MYDKIMGFINDILYILRKILNVIIIYSVSMIILTISDSIFVLPESFRNSLFIIVLPIIVSIIFIMFDLYKSGAFARLKYSSKIKKEFGKIRLFQKIRLFKTKEGLNLEEANLQDFDKKFLEYKNHCMCMTKNEIIFIGYTPKSKDSEIPEIIQKEYKFENINSIELVYTIKTMQHTYNHRQSTFRTIRDEYGNTRQEEIIEDVPVTETHSQQVILYINIYLQNVLVQGLHFNFNRGNKDNLHFAKKISRLCKEFNINCYLKKE